MTGFWIAMVVLGILSLGLIVGSFLRRLGKDD